MGTIKNPMIYKILLNSVVNNDIIAIKNLIDCGIDINKFLDNNITIIGKACEASSLDTIKFLVENGANINKCYTRDLNPIYIAIVHNRLSVIKYLISKDIDINYIKSGKESLLTLASIKDNIEIVKTLIEAGADLYFKNEDGNNFFHIACKYNNYKVVKYVLENFSEDSLNIASVENNENETSLIIASKLGYYEIVKLILDCRKNDIDDGFYDCNYYKAIDIAKTAKIAHYIKDNMPNLFDNILVISDRYCGAYSGGSYLAFDLNDGYIPSEVTGNDRECMSFWDNHGRHGVRNIGIGDTVEGAISSLNQQNK